MTEISQQEVAECMRFHAEYGCFPRTASADAVAMAKKLQTETEVMRDPFQEEE